MTSQEVHISTKVASLEKFADKAMNLCAKYGSFSNKYNTYTNDVINTGSEYIKALEDVIERLHQEADERDDEIASLEIKIEELEKENAALKTTH